MILLHLPTLANLNDFPTNSLADMWLPWLADLMLMLYAMLILLLRESYPNSEYAHHFEDDWLVQKLITFAKISTGIAWQHRMDCKLPHL